MKKFSLQQITQHHNCHGWNSDGNVPFKAPAFRKIFETERKAHTYYLDIIARRVAFNAFKKTFRGFLDSGDLKTKTGLGL